MKHKPTPAEIANFLADQSRQPTGEAQLTTAMIRAGWTNPQPILIQNELWLAATTVGCTLFVRGVPAAYILMLCGADPAIGADIQCKTLITPTAAMAIFRLICHGA